MGHVDERRIGRPIYACNRSGYEPRVKRRQLVDERKSKPLFDHPLDFSGGAGGASEMYRETQLPEHIHEARVRRWVKVRVTEYCDALGNFMDINLGVMSKDIV
jgi:hypothetical protein